MGICKHCKKEIKIDENEQNCPNCGKAPYNCWSCKTPITGETEECSVCKYYICPDCQNCGPECIITQIIYDTIDITNKRELIIKIREKIKSPPMRNCPDGVGISYAKERLRNMALKLQGFNVKNEQDSYDFAERFDKIKRFVEGYEWTIKDEKESGSYGHELREVSNLAVCMGIATKKVYYEKDKKGIKKKYEVYKRCYNKDACPYRNWNNLICYKCEKCGKTYSKEVEYCSKCPPYQKGKKKGELRKVKEMKSEIKFCDLPRNQFIIKGEDSNVNC